VPISIEDPDMVSRLLFEPGMRSQDNDLHWENVFQFPTVDGNVESVIWRKHAISIEDVHRHGCEKQKNDRAKGRSKSTYFGAITGNVGDIRSLQSSGGIRFVVNYVPKEGKAHAHIGFSPGSKKNDRNELKFVLRAKFGNLEPHACENEGAPA
jgi:hypothetical protein